MKTTLDLPAAALRQAKAVAADRGVTLKQFVTEALGEKLRRASTPTTSGRNAEPPWMAGFGALADLRDEKPPHRRLDRGRVREAASSGPEQ